MVFSIREINNKDKELIQNFQMLSSLQIIHSWHKDVGFRVAKSRNKAIAQSNADYIILIDGDTILHPEFIQDHINNSKVGFFIQGTRVLLSEDATMDTLKRMKVSFSFFSYGIRNRKNAIHSNFLSKIFFKTKKNLIGIKTCNMAFFKEDCIKVNGFNNEFEGWGREDSEFVQRLFNNGVKKLHLKFSGIQYHLYHNERKHNNINDNILQNTINKKEKWCRAGIDRYFSNETKE